MVLVIHERKEEVFSRDEKSCPILENMTITSGIKEIESKFCVHNLEKYSLSLTKEIQIFIRGNFSLKVAS